ncbi:MAG: hypothetical protein RIB60_10345 [Phycisphaerales bacterium]
MTTRSRLVMALGFAVLGATLLASTGCRTWMRGPGYKRLISSYAETVTLTDLTAEHLERERAAGVDEERLERIETLHDEVRTLRDEFHDSLDRRKREGWNRTRMNWCWREYNSLFPDDRARRWEYRRQRRVEVDEIRSRRTPLTHDQRLRRAPEPKDGFWQEGESWRHMSGIVVTPGVDRRLEKPQRSDGAFFTPQPQSRPQIEPYIPPADSSDNATDSLIRDMLEDQADTATSGDG